MRAATCFSGIGAPEVAMPHWDWLWSAEIEAFPSAVLKSRHPTSKNLGDVTADDFMQNVSAFGQIDVLAGGPPCQDFSVAGLRAGMTGDRGNLTLRFLEIIHAIRPRNVLVENVPGWLNMPDNAFGSFLAGLVGADDALVPCAKPMDGKSNAGWTWRKAGMVWRLIDGEDGVPVIIDNPEDYDRDEVEQFHLDAGHTAKWPSAGMVAGPRARVAWRVFDAQYFGLAQRRKRVFVVADFGNGADPAKVLFEPKGVSGNPPSRNQAGKEVAGTIAARTKGGGGLGTDFDLDGGLVSQGCAGETAPTLNAEFGSKLGLDNQHIDSGAGLFVMTKAFDCQSSGSYGESPCSSTVKARDYKDATDLVVKVTAPIFASDGQANAAFCEDQALTLNATNEQPYIAFDAFNQDDTGDLSKTVASRNDQDTASLIANVSSTVAPEISNALIGSLSGTQCPNEDATLIASRAVSFKPSHYTRGKDGAPSELSPPLSADADKGDQDAVLLVPIAFTSKDYGGDSTEDMSPTLRGMGHSDSHANGGGQVAVAAPIAFPEFLSGTQCASTENLSPSMGALNPTAVAFESEPMGFAQNQRDELRMMEVAGALAADPGMKQTTYVHHAWTVRRLTPTECARLQGFPDDYCNVTFRGKPAADGPIYKALGNSWAVPCGRWILERIERFMP